MIGSNRIALPEPLEAVSQQIQSNCRGALPARSHVRRGWLQLGLRQGTNDITRLIGSLREKAAAPAPESPALPVGEGFLPARFWFPAFAD